MAEVVGGHPVLAQHPLHLGGGLLGAEVLNLCQEQEGCRDTIKVRTGAYHTGLDFFSPPIKRTGRRRNVWAAANHREG